MEKRHSRAQRVLAIIAIILLLSMYVLSFIFALIHNSFARTMLKISIMGTAFIPILIYFLMMFFRLTHKKDNSEDESE